MATARQRIRAQFTTEQQRPFGREIRCESTACLTPDQMMWHVAPRCEMVGVGKIDPACVAALHTGRAEVLAIMARFDEAAV